MEVVIFAITSINDVMLDNLLKEHSRNEVFVFTPRVEIKALCDDYGIHCYFVVPGKQTISERDKDFAEALMPGMLSNVVFDNTELEMWKVLSLDRFKFWYSSLYQEMFKFLLDIDYDRCYVSSDLGDVLPWIVMGDAAYLGKQVIGIQTEPIRTKEFLDVAAYLKFDKFIVTNKEDFAFLSSLCPQMLIEVEELDGGKPVEFPEKESLRKGLGISENDEIYGVFFDKRDEWQCRKWLHENVGKANIIVVPVDTRSSQIAPDVLQLYADYIHLYDDPTILSICKRVVSFRYDAQYVAPFKDRILIMDYMNLNKAKALLP